MKIKQKIWSIPIIAILIFTAGMAVEYKSSSHTYVLLQRIGIIHYPYLHYIQALSGHLKGIQENFQNAIIINDKNSVAQAQQKARDFRKIGVEIAALDGKQASSQQILAQFDNYFVSAERAVDIMMGIEPDDAVPDQERMVAALKKIEGTLQREHATATQSFLKSLDDSKINVQGLLWINLASIIIVVFGLIYISYRLLRSMMRSLDYLQTGAQKVSQGDFTARIPEQGNDELTHVARSFNVMSEELQAVTEKRIQYEMQLETLNLELESRVLTRTAELGVALEESQKAHAAITYMADHDALTGLLNRRRFQEEFDRWGKFSLRYQRSGVLMFIDLDKFKDINDSYGHQAGDKYLLGAADLMKKILRSTDYLCRWGGDEFAVLLPEIDAAAAQTVAEKLITVFNEVPIPVVGHSLHISASIGIAALPEHTSDTGELMAFADAAMYKAKENGRGQCWIYAGSEHEAKRVDEHARWAKRIRRALDTDQFVLFYQPLLNLKTKLSTEYEALLRMEDTNGRFISPGMFLESAERFDLSVSLDRMVIRKAAYKIATLKHQNIPLSLSLNLSHKTLNDAGLVHYIAETIKEFDIDPANLAFEISEEALLQNINQVHNLSVEITKLGCHLILDDIGVGFSSFQYLNPLSIHSIKIRGDLIRNLGLSENRDYVASLIGRCRELNIEVVAKFVEDLSLLDTLRSLGVDYAQGFAVGKPLESLGDCLVSA